MKSPARKKPLNLGHWIPLWVVPCSIVLAIGTVWLRLAVVRTTYSIDQANREIRNLGLERQQLELKVTGLRSPRRLELLARTRFGLSPPQSDRIIHLDSGHLKMPGTEDTIATSFAAPIGAPAQ